MKRHQSTDGDGEGQQTESRRSRDGARIRSWRWATDTFQLQVYILCPFLITLESASEFRGIGLWKRFEFRGQFLFKMFLLAEKTLGKEEAEVS